MDRSVLGVFLSVSVSRTNQLQNGVEKHLFYRITIQSQAPQASELLPSGEQGGPHTFFFLQLRWLAADPTSMAIPVGGAPLQACTMSEADDGLCCSAFWIIFAAKGNRIHIDTIGQQCYGWHGFCHQMCPQGVPAIQSEGIMKYIKRLMCVTLDPFVHKACRWAHVPLLTHQHDKYNR